MTKGKLTGLVVGALLTIFVFAGPVGARHRPAPPPPPPPPAPASWQLVDYHQTICFSTTSTTGWYGIWISGTWTHSITIGISGLPAGGSYSTSYAPIPAGSSTGIYSLAYVGVQLTSSTPVGSTTASLWASDGQTQRTVPVTINVQQRCGNY